MVNVNGQNVAEPNDSATVTAFEELVNNHPTVSLPNNELGPVSPSGRVILVTDANGYVNYVPTAASKRLCTDANGNLVWR